MRKFLLVTALAFAAPAAFASGDLTADTMLGTSLEEVTANLGSMGYQVRKSEMEDGRLEVYFVNAENKTMGEAYVDLATGKITKLDMK